MMASADAPPPARPLADGTGAIIIALVYGLLGPIIGGALILPISAIAVGDMRPGSFLAGLGLMLITFPMSVPIAYYSAGFVALATGVVVAAVAHRRGRAPVWLAVAAPLAAFAGFALLNRVAGFSMPGAAGPGSGWGDGIVALWLAICVAASLICWLVTLPIQRRMR